jgi:hypothetical protein
MHRSLSGVLQGKCSTPKREVILGQLQGNAQNVIAVAMLFNSPIEVEQAQIGFWPVS